MVDEDLLRENGWEVECISPFEIRHEDGSFASMSAAYGICDLLRLYKIIDNISLIKNAYKAELIDKDMFITKIIETL